jgi:predicted dehydrogenase/threonine dehydrogenase-like Zn-dependent dehydrogenase
MHQLTQQLKSGHMEILEVPFPYLGRGQILVRNHFSVISTGTEGKTVIDARKGYIAKAKSRQKEVSQVIEMIKSNGLKETYKLVMNKLEAPAALGYSCSGEIISVGEDVDGYKVGDFVACGGQGAYHADVVSVYKNLCVKIPENVELHHAAFTTLAAIAIQGVRQADLRFGESCVIIGLGLIGQLTIQILNAAGIKTICIDIDEEQVKVSKKYGATSSLNRNQPGIEKIIQEQTHGIGADAVLITAGTSSLDPINFAGEVCRRKGKVVIVGAVPTGFERVNYYKKELELLMSSSYGPGRYDFNYEEKGIDYPVGYVRWTENRNMQTFVDLLSAGKIDMDKIISHTYSLEEAPEAYNMIIGKTEHYVGILIQYDYQETIQRTVKLRDIQYKPEEVNVGFIGAGNFAQNILLPRLKGLCNFTGIVTAHGNSARYVADKYKFKYCSDNANDLIEDKNTNTVFIATRHNLHARQVINTLKAGKNVFVEKPLAMTMEELEEIKSIFDSSQEGNRLMVGFNRRFSPLIQTIHKLFPSEQPKAMNFRINAGSVPADHWVNDPELGGGRIIGEGCHFIDLAMYIAGSPISSVIANAMNENPQQNDTISISLTFNNGSVANISYFSNGSKSLPKEYIEVFSSGVTAVIDDFKTLTIYDKKITKHKLKSQDKGHTEEVKQFIKSIKDGKSSPIPFSELYLSTKATFKVLDSIKEHRLMRM